VRRRIAVEEEEQRRIWISDKLWREREREREAAVCCCKGFFEGFDETNKKRS
jgi:hypothetical protein